MDYVGQAFIRAEERKMSFRYQTLARKAMREGNVWLTVHYLTLAVKFGERGGLRFS